MNKNDYEHHQYIRAWAKSTSKKKRRIEIVEQNEFRFVFSF